MKNIFSAAQTAAVLHSACTIMTPLLFAAAGGLFTELAGMLNIALEGLLLAGAFTAVTAVHFTGSLAAGICAAALVSIILASLFALTTLKLRSNVFITGLAVNLLTGGLTAVLSQYIFNTRGVIALRDIDAPAAVQIPLIENIPVIGALFSGHSLFVYAGWLLLPAAWIVIYKTPFGYRLRACGKHVDALSSLGIAAGHYRFAAFVLSGLCCGIGGAFLGLNLGAFVPNMSAGKGWIALVIIFLGGRRPAGLFIAALVFGLAEAFSNYAQGLLNISAEIILAMPFVLTLAAIITVSVYTKRAGNITTHTARTKKARRPGKH